MKRVDVASALIRDDHGNLLIVQNKKGDSFYWGLPGGSVEADETLEQAVVREVKEETGYSVAVIGLSSVREMFFAEKGNHALIITFHARVIGGEMEIDDPDNDIAEVRWVTNEEAKELMPSLFDELRVDSDAGKTLAFYAFEGPK